jgi:hypothetical protein
MLLLTATMAPFLYQPPRRRGVLVVVVDTIIFSAVTADGAGGTGSV